MIRRVQYHWKITCLRVIRLFPSTALQLRIITLFVSNSLEDERLSERSFTASSTRTIAIRQKLYVQILLTITYGLRDYATYIKREILSLRNRYLSLQTFYFILKFLQHYDTSAITLSIFVLVRKNKQKEKNQPSCGVMKNELKFVYVDSSLPFFFFFASFRYLSV